MDKETLGSRIREQRKERNMTLEKFATVVGVSTQFFGDIERGAKMPSVNTLIKIVNNMDISCDYLLRDEVVAAKPYVFDEISEKVKDLSPQHLKIIKDVIFVMADNFMAIEKLNTELEEEYQPRINPINVIKPFVLYRRLLLCVNMSNHAMK